MEPATRAHLSQRRVAGEEGGVGGGGGGGGKKKKRKRVDLHTIIGAPGHKVRKKSEAEFATKFSKFSLYPRVCPLLNSPSTPENLSR